MEFLPLEIISHIFGFLPTLEDRKAASLVCKLWYEAYQSPIFRKDEVVEILTNEVFDELTEFVNPNRIYFNVLARGVDINKNTKKFWDKFGPYIKTLSISNCDFREKSFLNVILRCDDLESLCIENCKELLMSGNLLEDENDRVALKRKLYGLKSLDLGHNRYLSDAIFIRFASICGHLQELHLPGCYISCHAGVYRKFYKNGHSDPSESVLTFPVIYDFIQESAENLKLLSFSDTLIDNDAVSSIAQTKDLSLRELNLRGCLQLSYAAIVTLSDFQLSLTHLDLALCSRINDEALLKICSRLIKLKYLSIQGCRLVTDLGMSDLWRLTKLSRLNVSECCEIHDEGIVKGLCRRLNPYLEELNLSQIGDISDSTIVQLMEFIPNIRTLDIGHSYNGVTDKSIQAIFTNAKELRSLTLTSCERLTDRGLTGIALKPAPSSPSAANRHFKIHLGSKEEMKIVRDAKLKQDVQEICESIDSNADSTGSSLSSLKHLHTLNLSECRQISDVSLKYAFKLDDLRSLDLSNCTGITSKGLLHVCENNRSIESLSLKNCPNVNDMSIFNVLKNMKRLKTLTFGNYDIKDGIAEYFKGGWTNLRLLDVRTCCFLSASAINQIMEYHPRLKVLHFSAKANDFPFNNSYPLVAPPPPLPIDI